MTFKEETEEFAKDVQLTLQKMSLEKDKKEHILRRTIVSGDLGTPILELKAVLEIVKL